MDPTGPTPEEAPGAHPDPSVVGPLSPEAAKALLDRAAALFEAGDYPDAARHYQRVIGQPDAAITAAALLGLGQALYRLDEESDAMSMWESVLRLPETPSTYRAWREVAAAKVRSGDLQDAIHAYREAERRASPEDRREIASRLGWLLKETGNQRAAGRYFSRARATGPAIPLTWIIVGITVVVSVTAWSLPFDRNGSNELYNLLQLDKAAVAAGQWYRLWTVTLLHAPPTFGYLHLFFNMYALFLIGPIVERLYGSRLMLILYLLCAAGGSVASFVFSGPAPSVGASGAIFGMIGVLLSATTVHRPVVDRQSRGLLAQLGPIVVINLAFGFLNAETIDNAAHIGGLVSGLWLGYILVPGRAPTLAGIWQRPGSPPAQNGASVAQGSLRLLGVVALVVVLVVGVVIGTEQRRAARTIVSGTAMRSSPTVTIDQSAAIGLATTTRRSAS